MIDNRLVGRRISAMRQENAMTQQQLAAIMNVSHQAVSKWESGQALPDIQTMMELTRFFGITVEQLVSDSVDSEQECSENGEYNSVSENDNNSSEPKGENESKEVKYMNIQQLLQMAPFMSKETVEEIVSGIETVLSAAQIARIAPYVRPECVEQLIEKHKPELTWESLRRLAPYLSREYVDNLARAIASGKETVKPATESINKTINDIGKAFDDIGKGVGQAMKKALRFGETVINEVSSAINDISSEPETGINVHVRSARAVALRKRAFERALSDGQWEWIGRNIGEVESDPELCARIAKQAREAGKTDWIRQYMGGFADETTIETAIQEGNWEWLGENAWQMDADKQCMVALAAMNAENWAWLSAHAGQLMLMDCAEEIAENALVRNEEEVAIRMAERFLMPEACARLARHAADLQKLEAFEGLILYADNAGAAEISIDLAEKHAWEYVRLMLIQLSTDVVEKLLEIAVEQGDFDAVDMLDSYL